MREPKPAMCERHPIGAAPTFHHEIRGALVGSLWWPAGADAWSPLVYDLTREDDRFTEPATLRDHCLHVLAERGGDFQGAEFADCALISTITITRGARIYRRQRVTDLARCKSVADLVRADWELPE